MKRDMDLVREMLLWMEEEESRIISFNEFKLFHDDRNLTIGHLGVMLSGGLIEDLGKGNLRISWAGYEFLDKVRDPEIWSKTKSSAARVGSWSVKLLGEMASGIIKAKATEMGIPLA